MGTQIVRLDPLNKIKTYLKYFSAAKIFFWPKNFFFTDFIEEIKKIRFYNFMHDYIFTNHKYFLWVPSYPKSIVIHFSDQMGDLGGWFGIKMSNFLIASLEKTPYFLQTQTRELNAILSRCIYSPLTVNAQFAKIFMKKKL